LGSGGRPALLATFFAMILGRRAGASAIIGDNFRTPGLHRGDAVIMVSENRPGKTYSPGGRYHAGRCPAKTFPPSAERSRCATRDRCAHATPGDRPAVSET
jgi:hypothetical protein